MSKYLLQPSIAETRLLLRLRRVLGIPSLDAWHADFIHLIKGHAKREMLAYLTENEYPPIILDNDSVTY